MFKVGDKVKILPSARDVGVYDESINKIGVIVKIYSYGTILVRESKYIWSIDEHHIEPVIPVGAQLMFPFMYD